MAQELNSNGIAKPSVGRIVHIRGCAAIVTLVHDDGMSISATIFLPGGSIEAIGCAAHGVDWSWPPRS